MAALLLNVCGNPAENKTADGNTGNTGNGETLPSRPKSKFAVTYTGGFARGSDPLTPIDVGSGNDGSTLAKAYTITLDTRTSLILIMAFEPRFKPAEAATDATFAIQAIDPATGADLTDTAEVFDTKFGPANLIFRAEASLPPSPPQLGFILNPANIVPQNTKIPASNTGHLAYKITITPKPGSAYDGPKAYVFIKIAIRG